MSYQLKKIKKRTGPESYAIEKAIKILQILEHSPRPAIELEAEAARIGISKQTLHRARHRLGIKSRKTNKTWTLYAPGKIPV